MKPSRATFAEYGRLYRLLATALAMNVPLISLALILNLRGSEFSWLSAFYAVFVFVGCYALPLFFVFSLLFLLLFPLRRTVTTVMAALASLYLFYLLIDVLMYQIFKFHFDTFWLRYLLEDFHGLGMGLATVITMIVALIGIVALEYGILKLARRVRHTGLVTAAFALCCVLALGASQIMHIVAHEKNDSRITSLTPHFPFYYPATSHGNAQKYGDLIPIEVGDSEAVTAGYSYSSLHYPLAEIPHSLPEGQRPPNVIFLLLESWRGEMMDETVTPHIHELARSSSEFLDHFSSGNSTTSGFFGLFYGLFANYWTAVKANSAHIDNPLLIDIMKEQGFSFGIYADSNFDRHKISDTVFRGIEVHEVFAGNSIDENDADLNRQVIEFAGEQVAAGRPFMALAFYKSSHFNYYYPEEFAPFQPARKMNMVFASSKKDPELYLNDQRNAVHYIDSLVGEVLSALDSLGVMDETIVVVTSDHGEEFNDNGANYWGHGSNFTRYQTQVPLILHLPGREPARVTSRTSHVDVVPTILSEYFGCSGDMGDYSNGQDLFATQQGTRPLVIGSYVNHAFLLGEDVFAIYPMYTKKYKLGDINQKAGRPDARLMREVMQEMKRFYTDDGRDGLTVPASLGMK